MVRFKLWACLEGLPPFVLSLLSPGGTNDSGEKLSGYRNDRHDLGLMIGFHIMFPLYNLSCP